MTNDLVPHGSGSWLDQLNLPKLIAGPAGDAIARLVGGAVDIPAAMLQRVTQGIRDKTEAKSAVSKAVAEAAGNLAKDDPEIVRAAAFSLLSKELRHQSNREAIARKTLQVLQAQQSDTVSAPPHRIEDDWLNIFQRYAEEASSERMQEIWAQVLAGEIRRPKAFTLQTLRFVAELDEEMGAMFEKHAPSIMDAHLIPFPLAKASNWRSFFGLRNSD